MQGEEYAWPYYSTGCRTPAATANAGAISLIRYNTAVAVTEGQSLKPYFNMAG
jgi:hypothetical protein